MAKGQMRSNRETKKPKKDAAAKPPANTIGSTMKAASTTPIKPIKPSR